MSDPDKYARCRTLGHSWVPVNIATGEEITNAPRKLSVNGITSMELICDVCGTHRNDFVVTRTGVIRRRKYSYVDGYCLSKGEERKPRTDYRMRLLKLGLGRIGGKR